MRTVSSKKSHTNTHYLRFPEHELMGECQMASTSTTSPSPAKLPRKRADLDRRSIEYGRLAIASVFIVSLLIGEAALFAHAVKTMDAFVSQADVQVP